MNITNQQIVDEFDVIPCGSTHVDGRVYDDLVSMIELVDLLIYKLKESAEHKDRVEYSMRKVGSHADDYLKSLAKELSSLD